MKIKYFAVIFMVMVLFFLVACGPAKQVPADSDLTPEELNQLPADLKEGKGEMALAGQAVKWENCVDGDNPTDKWNDKQQLLIKSSTSYEGGSKEDKCYTWYKGTAKEKTRLIEGTCLKKGDTSKFRYWYADCDVYFGKGAKCVEGKCVNAGSVNLMLSNVKFTSNGVDVDQDTEALDFTMPVEVSFDVTNEGDIINTVFQNEVQACKPSAESCNIVSGVTVQGFQAKQTTHHTPGTFMLTSSMIEDNKVKIRVVVDGDGQIKETNENDNMFEMVLKVENVISPKFTVSNVRYFKQDSGKETTDSLLFDIESKFNEKVNLSSVGVFVSGQGEYHFPVLGYFTETAGEFHQKYTDNVYLNPGEKITIVTKGNVESLLSEKQCSGESISIALYDSSVGLVHPDWLLKTDSQKLYSYEKVVATCNEHPKCIMDWNNAIDSGNEFANDLLKKSIVTYTSDTNTYQLIDSCEGNILTEYFCDTTKIGSNNFACPNGCNKGVCSSSSTSGGSGGGGSASAPCNVSMYDSYKQQVKVEFMSYLWNWSYANVDGVVYPYVDPFVEAQDPGAKLWTKEDYKKALESSNPKSFKLEEEYNLTSLRLWTFKEYYGQPGLEGVDYTQQEYFKQLEELDYTSCEMVITTIYPMPNTIYEGMFVVWQKRDGVWRIVATNL